MAAAAAGAGAAAVAPSAGASSSGNTPKAGGGGAASAYTIPRRRVSYLIPPPPGDAPPPFLSLPAPEDIKHAKKGNPNPLIVLSTAQAGQAGAANDDGDGDDGLFPTSSPARRGRGESYSSSNGRYSQGDASSPPLMFGSPGGRSNTSHNPPSFPGASQRGFGKPLQQSRSSRPARPTQWHPEHTLGVSALALDTSTVIDSSSSGSGRRPAGILYSGGRDGLVASWELGLPLQRRDPTAGYVGTHAGGRYESSASGRGRGQPGSSVQAFAGTPRPRRYRPRWAEDAYDSDSSDSSREGSRESSGRSDTHGEGRHDDFDEDGGSSSSREGGSSEEDVRAFGGAAYQSSPRLRLDTTFTDDNDALYPLHGSNKRGGRASNGLRLDMSSSSAKRQGSKLGSSGRRSTLIDQRLPYEDRWCIDERLLNEYIPPSATFRQAHRGHTDWVNDIVLCNLNQTVISASSDRMIRAWNPHDPHRSMLPASLGSHNDYVKCLAHSREHRWVASGGFDRRIKIWDILETRPQAPIVDIGIDASIYSLATNAAGSTIACGSPEKVIRVFDPRKGSANVARLVGHADNVRSIVISEDGRHMLSASSDATVKMWSVAMQRCLHTFTYHSDSVWSLFSTHPDLEVFYSGDRTGAVCKVDFADCGDIASEGECVVLLRNRDETRPGSYPSSNDGITRIIATDDAYIWTASGSSSICRWKDVPSRSKRAEATAGSAMNAKYATSVASQNSQRIAQSGNYHADPAAQPILSSSPSEASGLFGHGRNFNGPPPASGFDGGASMNRTVSGERSVAFAAQTAPQQRFSPATPSSPFSQQRPSNLRKTASKLSTRGAPDFSSPTLSSSAFPANPATDLPSEVPSINQIPMESLIPLYTPDDPYSRSSGLMLRKDGTGGVGYSASVLSLHRTNSRPLPSTSPFSTNLLSSTPPSSNLSAPRGFASASGPGRTASPMHIPASHRAGSILEEQEDDDEAHAYNSQPQREQPKSEAFLLAEQEFEDRETTLDANPLRSQADDVIRGRHGLVRAELLNDRRTVISLDTLGEVAVWDIVLAMCIGRFSRAELQQRMIAEDQDSMSGSVSGAGSDYEGDNHEEKRDILEFVRNQVEGEAVVSPWCSVETKTGLLTIHIEQSRAFEAEAYLDESGVEPKPEYKPDQRLNLGKWVLRNLFEGFIAAELRAQARQRSGSGDSSASQSSSSVNEDVRSGHAKRPSHISLSDIQGSPNPSELASSWSSTVGQTPNQFSIALATPAMTPAVLPDATELQARHTAPRLLPNSSAHPLPTIPQSPHGHSSVPSTPMSATQQGGDYFSRPRNAAGAPPGSPGLPGQQTPRPTTAPVPATPGLGAFATSPALKTSKMSRFKSFGKKEAKKELLQAAETVAPVVEERPSTGSTSDDELDAHLSPPQRAQQKLLRTVFSHPCHPSSWSETPPIRFTSDLPVVISEESSESGTWSTIYRSLLSRNAAELKLLEQSLPVWLLEFTMHNVIQTKEPVKIAFILQPWGGPEKAGLPELPSGNARLSATKMLRMRKACHYVAEKLELDSWKQRQQYQAASDANRASTSSPSAALARSHTRTSLSSSSSSHLSPSYGGPEPPTLLPEDEVEILCNDQIVPLNITLAACARYSYGKSGDIYLTYRRRQTPRVG